MNCLIEAKASNNNEKVVSVPDVVILRLLIALRATATELLRCTDSTLVLVGSSFPVIVFEVAPSQSLVKCLHGIKGDLVDRKLSCKHSVRRGTCVDIMNLRQFVT